MTSAAMTPPASDCESPRKGNVWTTTASTPVRSTNVGHSHAPRRRQRMRASQAPSMTGRLNPRLGRCEE
jgi:hypothetical protein